MPQQGAQAGKQLASYLTATPAENPAPPTCFGVQLKYVVLVMMTVQNAGAVLLMRYTRSMPGETEFITQTAVIMQEALKGLACVVILMVTEGTVSSAWANKLEALKTAVPALLYLGQNNLQVNDKIDDE